MNTLTRIGILALTAFLAGCGGVTLNARMRGSSEVSGVVTRNGVPVADTPICASSCDAGDSKKAYGKTDAEGRFHLPAVYNPRAELDLNLMGRSGGGGRCFYSLSLGCEPPKEVTIWRAAVPRKEPLSASLECDLDRRRDSYNRYCKEMTGTDELHRGSPEASGVITRSGVPIADTPVCMALCIASCSRRVYGKTDAAGRFHLYDPLIEAEERKLSSINYSLELDCEPRQTVLLWIGNTFEDPFIVNLECDLDKSEKYGHHCKKITAPAAPLGATMPP